MEKNEKQLTYETPEADAIEIRMENPITDSCIGVDTEPVPFCQYKEDE